MHGPACWGSSASRRAAPPLPQAPVCDYKFRHKYNHPAVFKHRTLILSQGISNQCWLPGCCNKWHTLEFKSWVTRGVWHCLRCIIYDWECRSDLPSWFSIPFRNYMWLLLWISVECGFLFSLCLLEFSELCLREQHPWDFVTGIVVQMVLLSLLQVRCGN